MWQLAVEEEWLAGARVGLDEHRAHGHIADDSAEAVGEWSAGAKDRDADYALGSALLVLAVFTWSQLATPL